MLEAGTLPILHCLESEPANASAEAMSIVAELLGRDQVSPEQSFAELGGHSLAAAQLIARVRERFGVELPLRAVFECGAVGELAQAIESALPDITTGAIRPPMRGTDAPLSHAQQRLWFLHHIGGAGALYNQVDALRLTGRLDAEVLQRALSEIVRRHATLRTRFSDRDGVPIQNVDPRAAIRLMKTDVSALRDPEAAARRIMAADEGMAFELTELPLLRTRLICLRADDHVLLLTAHHIVSDDWSAAIFRGELKAIYAAFLHGARSPLPGLDVQYADYAIWQRDWLASEVAHAQLGYWRERLSGLDPLELPTDFSTSATPGYAAGTVALRFDLDTVRRLRELASAHGITLFMALAASWQIYLGRVSGQRDVAIGTPVANRGRKELDSLIGFFVNTLVLRLRWAPGEETSEVLRRTREICLSAYENQDIPFDRVVEELQPDRQAGRTPLIRVMLVLYQPPVVSVLERANRCDLEFTDFGDTTVRSMARFDLTLSLRETASGEIAGHLQFARDLFDAASAERIARQWQFMVTALASNVGGVVEDLPLLSEAERKQLTEQWGAGERIEAQWEGNVWDQVRRQTETRPDAVAAVSGERQLSYGELDRRASTLAAQLAAWGIGAESRVVIALERGLEALIGLYGIGKAGAAYVPVEPDYPEERVGYLLDDARVQAVVTSEAIARQWPDALAGRRLLCLDQVTPQGEALGQVEVASGDLGQLAYVLYTSGSTGRPKGVEIPHGALVNYTQAMGQRLGYRAGQRFAMVQPLGVDSSKTVLYGSLCNGGVLHLVEKEEALDGMRMAWYMERHGIEVQKIAPSHLSALQVAGGGEGLLPREWLVIGGEAAGWEWAKGLAESGRCRVLNHYGPTETTVGVLVWEIEAGSEAKRLAIGRPLGNTRAYVVDEEGRLAPGGGIGELWIGGRNVGRGYSGQARQTAERFVPDGWSGEEGGRLYRTGDRVRWNGRGELEYWGRVDEQVKIRGYRVELGEVEGALRRVAGVEQSAAAVRDGGLVGYVVGAGVSGRGVREAMRRLVPEALVPAAVVVMEELPRTGHGKLDRKKLPEPEWGEEGREKQGPRTAAEEILAALWGEVLGIEPPGVDESFFALGGHSLNAMRVVGRIASLFQVNLSLRSMMENPTVEGIAQVLAQEVGGADVLEQLALSIYEAAAP
jgi:amino acid adenylation domain-containing protein